MGYWPHVTGAVVSRAGRRSAIAAAVLLLHVLAFLALLATRLVDTGRPPASQQTALMLISLPPMSAKSQRTEPSTAAGPGRMAPMPDLRALFGPYAPHTNAITIPPYVAQGPPHCPSPLKPGSPEWERRCPWLAKALKPPPPPEETGYEDFALVSHDSPTFKMWEAEQKKRNAPVELPCGYVRKDPATGTTSNMADIGCAAKRLFGR